MNLPAKPGHVIKTCAHCGLERYMAEGLARMMPDVSFYCSAEHYAEASPIDFAAAQMAKTIREDRAMTLWESPDDKGLYIARCKRTGERTGVLELIVLRNGVEDYVTRRQNVTLAYGARFGPDVEDVRLWNMMATEWSEKLDKENA